MAIEISTSQFVKTVDAKIDGKLFKVRRLGAGESLDASQLLSKIADIQPKMAEMRDKYNEISDEAEKRKLGVKIMQLTAQIGGLNRQIEDIYAKIFDGGDDGTAARDLVSKLGINQVPALVDMVFKEA